jgi:hypothetical protein
MISKTLSTSSCSSSKLWPRQQQVLLLRSGSGAARYVCAAGSPKQPATGTNSGSGANESEPAYAYSDPGEHTQWASAIKEQHGSTSPAHLQHISSTSHGNVLHHNHLHCQAHATCMLYSCCSCEQLAWLCTAGQTITRPGGGA